MFGKRKKREELPEKAQLGKYYEMDGALRAYANRMAVLGLLCGAAMVVSIGLFTYVRLQPPVIIRVDQAGEASVVGGETVHLKRGLIPAVSANAKGEDGATPTDVEGQGLVRRFLSAYLTYTPANVERQYADALNMMTNNFRTLTMNQFRDDDTLGKIKTDSITSAIRIRSIEPIPNSPWSYQVFAVKEVRRLTQQKAEQSERMVCRYQIRLVYSGRSQQHPSGLLVGEFWEQQMTGERNIDLDQKSILIDRN